MKKLSTVNESFFFFFFFFFFSISVSFSHREYLFDFLCLKTFSRSTVRLLMFVGGPCNYGVGATAVLDSIPSKKGLANVIDSVLRDLDVELSELSSVTSSDERSSSLSSIGDTSTTSTDASSSQHLISDIPIQPQTEHYREWVLRWSSGILFIHFFPLSNV
jgi:hypothetical protein